MGAANAPARELAKKTRRCGRWAMGDGRLATLEARRTRELTSNALSRGPRETARLINGVDNTGVDLRGRWQITRLLVQQVNGCSSRRRLFNHCHAHAMALGMVFWVPRFRVRRFASAFVSSAPNAHSQVPLTWPQRRTEQPGSTRRGSTYRIVLYCTARARLPRVRPRRRRETESQMIITSIHDKERFTIHSPLSQSLYRSPYLAVLLSQSVLFI